MPLEVGVGLPAGILVVSILRGCGIKGTSRFLLGDASRQNLASCGGRFSVVFPGESGSTPQVVSWLVEVEGKQIG